MRLTTTIQGIPCEVEVSYQAPMPMVITDTGYGDAEPPESEEFEVVAVYDRKGYRAPWLAQKMTDADDDRIYDEYKQAVREGEVWARYI